MKRAYYFPVLIALFFSQFATQALCFDHQAEMILSRFKILQQQGAVTERQAAETLTNLGCPFYSRSDVTELVNVLREGIREDRLNTILLRVIEQNRGCRDEEDDYRPSLFRKSRFGKNLAHLPGFQKQAAMSGMPQDFQVNENAGRTKKDRPAMDMNDDGNFVIAWEDMSYDYRRNIYCQLYNSSGSPLGDKFKVNEDVVFSCMEPDVAMDSNGNFVVVWVDPRSTPNDPDIYFQRFNSNGEPLGNNVKVNADGVICSHYNPAIDMDDSGNFVIVWYDDHRLGDWKYDIYGQRYSSSGTPLGSNFMINDGLDISPQKDPAIVVDGSGNFIVVWDGGNDIYRRRYNSSGAPLEDNFKVSSLYRSREPDVGVDDSGNSVIVWANPNDGIYGRRYNSSGAALGDQFDVHDAPAGTSRYYRPSLSVQGDGGFVVIWEDQRSDADLNDSNYYIHLYYQRFNSAAQPIGSNSQVNEYIPNLYYQWSYPVSGVDNSGNFMFVWPDKREDYDDIYCQRYNSSGTLLGVNFRLNDDEGTTNQRIPAIGADGHGNLVIAWEDYRNRIAEPDVYCQRYDSSGAALGPNFMVNDDGPLHYKPDIGVNESGNFVVVWYDNRSGNHEIYGQRYTSNGAARGVNFRVSEDAGSVFSRNDPAVSMDNNGNFAVTWEDKRNGDCDVYCQRFNSNGVAQSLNFKVNTDAGTTTQDDPAIEFDSNGNFCIVWEDNRNGDDDIYCQRYSSDGSPISDNFLVNDDAASVNNYNPDIAIHSAGSFVIVWHDKRNVIRDIYGQRYSSSGDLIGVNFKVNDNTESFNQFSPSIDIDSKGNFAVAWYTTYDTYKTDNEIRDIYCRRFDSNGNAEGAAYQVNSNTDQSLQDYPRVVLANRRLICTWEDSRVAFTANDIFARIDLFNAPPASPAPISPETNSYTAANPPTLSFTIPADTDGDSLHFKIEVATDNNFNYPIPGSPFDSQINSTGFTPIPPLAEGGGSCSYTLQSALNSGTYFWRTSAGDELGYGEASEIYNFIIETSAPYTSDHIPQKYAQEVATDTDISFHIKDEQSGVKQSGIVMKVNNSHVTAVITGTSSDYTVSYDPPTDFDYNQTVTVTIDAEDFAGNKMNTDGYYFITAGPGNLAPEAPVLSSPVDNATIFNNKPQLSWSAPSDANGDSLHFKVEIATDSDFVNSIYGSPFESRNNTTGFNPVPPLAEGGGTCNFTLPFLLEEGDYWWRITARDELIYGDPSETRKFTVSTNSAELPAQALPENYVFYHNYPNPFNPVTALSYALPKSGSVLLQIFDIDGRLVTTLMDGPHAAGIHSINWAARDKTGKLVTSGIYICRLTAGNVVLHRKLMLVK